MVSVFFVRVIVIEPYRLKMYLIGKTDKSIGKYVGKTDKIEVKSIGKTDKNNCIEIKSVAYCR